MDDEHISNLGIRDVWGSEHVFGIAQPDRRHHLYVIGKTGSGKSTLLRNLIVQDIEAGRGVALVDPHGDLADDILDYIPPRRTDDVVYFNPADLAHPIGFNILEQVPPDDRPAVASGVVATFKHLYGHSWGPRLEYILYNSVAALLDFPVDPGATLLGVPRLLTDERYRDRVIRHVLDPKVRSFWTDEFASWNERFTIEAIMPVQNKVGAMLQAPAIRNVLGQVRSTISPRRMMDESRILIVNLSKGQLGEDKSNLLGSLLVTSFQLAALARSPIPEDDRVDFHLVLDEFHNFTTDAFASILSEARKYRLCLTLAHQYLDQLSEPVKDAVLGNVGSLIAFRLGAEDAERLAKEFTPYSHSALTDCGRYQVCAKLMHDGETREPFFGRTLAPQGRRHGRRENIMVQSRQRYGRRRDMVEGKIAQWMRN